MRKGFAMSIRVYIGAAVAALSLGIAGCKSPEQAAEAPAATEAAADHGGHVGGRVFFVSPKDGETIKNGHTAQFGSDMFQIAAVPEGDVTVVRAGTGHFHLGMDTDCLPAGSEIPKADPWIHFGKGTNTIELNMTPGPHKLSVQAGDDKHVTMTGLCETINVTVAP
jgi:hypothetical protein